MMRWGECEGVIQYSILYSNTVLYTVDYYTGPIKLNNSIVGIQSETHVLRGMFFTVKQI